MNMRDYILKENQKIRELSLWRDPQTFSSSRANALVHNGRTMINFSTNDYLGYATHPLVIQSGIQALAAHGAGGKSSRLISGTLELHAELEQELARYKGTESALLFPTGFMANLGVIAGLLRKGDAVILDRLNHASLIDAAKLSGARLFVYEHASIPSLARVLERTRGYGKRLVATDSLFSMDGDFAPLPEIVQLCKKHGVWLLVDDAHATGLFGRSGSGLAEHFNLQGKIDIIMGTLSKALGSQGGFVCGSLELIDYLKNRARAFIFTTALCPANAAAALTALRLAQKEPEKRGRLLDAARRLSQKINEIFPSPLAKSVSQILPLWCGTAERALVWSRQLAEQGLFVPAIRPPTVPKNSCRLRLSLSYDHSDADWETLARAFSEMAADRGLE